MFILSSCTVLYLAKSKLYTKEFWGGRLGSHPRLWDVNFPVKLKGKEIEFEKQTLVVTVISYDESLVLL